jgi:hypothetical protein
MNGVAVPVAVDTPNGYRIRTGHGPAKRPLPALT